MSRYNYKSNFINPGFTQGVGLAEGFEKYDLNDLENDPEFTMRAERFLGSIGQDDDIFEYLRDEQFNLSHALYRASKSKHFTEQQKLDYAYLRTKFEGADVGSTSQWLELIKDGAVDMVFDPTLLLAVLTTPFTFGGSLATQTAAKGTALYGLRMLGSANAKKLTNAQLTKAIADGTLEQGAKAATRLATGIGATEAGGWMGLHNYANQNLKINTEMRQAFSAKELVGSAALGTLFGGFVGRYGQKWSNFTNPVLQLNNKPKNFSGPLGNFRLKFHKFIDRVVTAPLLGNARKMKVYDDMGLESAKIWRGILDHDSQLGIGKRSNKAIDWSFPEQLNARRGQYMFEYEGQRKGLWAILEDLAPDGVMLEAQEQAIVRFLRGKKSALRGQSDEVKAAAKGLRKWLDDIAGDAKKAGFGDIAIKNYFPRSWDREKIRSSLKENGGDGKFVKQLAKDLELDEVATANIVDDMLNLNNSLYASHSNLLTHGRKFQNLDDNLYEDFLSNDLIENLATYGLNAANAIQVRQTFLGGTKGIGQGLNIKYKTKQKRVQKGTTVEGEEVLTFADMKASNQSKFIDAWIKPMEKELMEKFGRRLTARDKKQMISSFESVSGAVTFFENQIIQGAYDGIKLANAMAYLPLATVSSLSEGLIAATRTSGKNSIKNFIYQMENGHKFLGSDLKSLLIERRGLSKIEANRDANKVFIAVDDVQSDRLNRLTGEVLQNKKMNALARGFYKANFLLPWTKTIELAAFNTGRDIVEESLTQLAILQKAGVKIFDDVDTFVKSTTGKDKDIIKKLEGFDGVWTGKGNLYKRTNFLKEQIYDLGIDVEKGLKWLNSGANRNTNFWRKEMSMAGGRFSRSVILPTSREFSKVPRFMTNPRWDIFTQFLRYPTVFSNTVLKNFARDTLNNPTISAPRFAAFVAGSTAIARGTNYWRASDERQEEYDRYARELDDDSLAGKAFDLFVGKSAEENLRAFQRVGLLGPAEYALRYVDALEYNNPFMATLTLGGPVMGDLIGSGVYGRGFFENLSRKTPLIGTRNVIERYTGVDPFDPIEEFGREIDESIGEEADDLLELYFKNPPKGKIGPGKDRRGYQTGGVIRSDMKDLGRYMYAQGGQVTEPRAFRNNNPLNMALGAVDPINGTFNSYDGVAKYHGVIGMDSGNLGGLRANGVDYQLESFAQFKDIELGSRANFHNLRKNYNGLTLGEIGQKFSRTDTDTYANNVANFANQVGGNVTVDSVIDFENNPEQSIAIFRGMARLEAGKWDERLTNEMLLRAYESSKTSMDDSIYSTTDWITDKEAASQIARNLAEKVIKN